MEFWSLLTIADRVRSTEGSIRAAILYPPFAELQLHVENGFKPHLQPMC